MEDNQFKQTAPNFTAAPPMPQAVAPPMPMPQAAAPAAVEFEDGGSTATNSLKDANWVAILVSIMFVAMSIAIIYHSAYKIKYYNKNFNNFKNQIAELQSEVDDVKKEVENQNFLTEEQQKPITLW